MSARPTFTANETFVSKIAPENWEKWCGQVVQGKFRLEQYLGGSDRSAVFLAKNEEPGAANQGTATTAIKLFLAKPASADAQIALWKQASNLSHPHVMRVFQWGRCEIDGAKLLYVVTEYAEENLAQILPQRPLTPDETKQMLAAILDALGYLHGKGFVHGYLRPSNVQVVNDQLKLSSDGIAKINEPTGGKRSLYDPPEMATMTTSTAGDIWSLGMVLAETLTQKLPAVDVFKIDDPKQKDPVVSAFIPEPFREIVRNCLRSNPQQRWTIERIAAYLKSPNAVLDTEAVPAPRKTSTKRATFAATTPESREPSGKRGLGILIATAVLILAVIAGVMIYNSHPASTQSSSTTMQEQQTPQTSAPQASDQQSAGEQSAQPAPMGQQNTAVNTSVPSAQTTTTPGVVHQVIPQASPGARRTVHGKVRVQVRAFVDETGNVTRTGFDSHGPSNYFANLAQNAAGQWKFVPAQTNGQNVSSEWVLKFAFGRKGTEVSPSRANSK